MHDERSPYYYLPGGRVMLHETAEAAVLREIKEELQADAKIIRPLWLNQSFFTEDVTQERYHEICLYFLLDITHTDIPSRGNIFTVQEEKHTLTFEWLPFCELKEKYLYPLFIQDEIFHLPSALTLLSEFE